MGISFARAAMAAAAICAAICACGGSSHGPTFKSTVPGGAAINAAEAAALLEDAQDLKPAEVSSTLWRELGEALVEELRAAKSFREASAVPSADNAAVDEFTLSEQAGGALRFHWYYSNRGDYNQDGLVNVGIEDAPMVWSDAQVMY